MERLADIRRVVDAILLARQNQDDMRFGFIHLYGVSTLCAMIAHRRGMDVEICAVAGMLHDISSFETGDPTEHAGRSAARAEVILQRIRSFSAAEVGTITAAIVAHSAKDKTDGPVAEVLKDADVLQYHYGTPFLRDSPARARRCRDLLRELGQPVGPTGTPP